MPSNSFLLAQILFFGKVTKDRFAAWQRLHTTPPEHMLNNTVCYELKSCKGNEHKDWKQKTF